MGNGAGLKGRSTFDEVWEVIAMENLNQNIADALNSVSNLDVFNIRMGRIFRKQVGCDPVEIPTTKALRCWR